MPATAHMEIIELVSANRQEPEPEKQLELPPHLLKHIQRHTIALQSPATPIIVKPSLELYHKYTVS